MKNKAFALCVLCIALCSVSFVQAQDIPQHISYTRIYDFLDELANEKIIDLNSGIKPYSRTFITKKLLEAQEQSEKLNRRQRKELEFNLNEFALENNQLPERGWPKSWENEKLKATLIQPAFYYKDNHFRARINPLLGMHIWYNQNGSIIKRWYGAEFQGMIGKHLSVYGSLRDISIHGDLLSLTKKSNPNDRYFQYNYLTLEPGYQYKESAKGGDYSDSRGGIKYAWKWGSVGLIKDNVVWGDNYHGSNILSGRAPSFPMLTLNLKPARWFELNYFHGWLVSNVLDSTKYYMENKKEDAELQKHYRPANKYIAANMFTFTPIRNLNLSIGNAIIYAENNPQPAYFIPIAFYKSMDHVLTKGVATENQNSMLFLNFSSRNIKHLHLYVSVFIDEIKFSRFKPSSKDKNPISYKVGANLSNFPIQNLSLVGEFTRTNIISYKHSIETLSWASNSHNLGHYLGDNAQEIYVSLLYKPIRGLDFNLSYVNAIHGKEYNYVRSNIIPIISQPALGKTIWSNQTFGLKAQYEVFNNGYAIVNFEYSDIKAFENGDDAIAGERKMTAEETLNYFTPKFLQGKNATLTIGFSFGF